MDKFEWKKEALWYILKCREWENSPYRQEREYSNYVKRFLFNGEEITFDGSNSTFRMRLESRQLPMSPTEYLIG